MRFDEWLDAEGGRSNRIAKHFKVSRSAVSQWKVNGVPVAKIHAVHELTEGQVSLTELLVPHAARSPRQQQAASGTRRGQMG